MTKQGDAVVPEIAPQDHVRQIASVKGFDPKRLAEFGAIASKWGPPPNVIDNDSYVRACEEQRAIATWRREVVDYFKPMKAAAYATHQMVCSIERMFLDRAAAAEDPRELARVSWEEAQEAERRKAEVALEKARRDEEEAARLEEATALEEAGDTAAAAAVLDAPITSAPVVLPSFTPRVAGVGTRVTWDFEITSFEALVKAVAAGTVPMAYLSPNESAIRARVRAEKGATQIPGIRPYEKRTGTTRTR